MMKIFPQNRNERKKRKTWIFIFAVFALLGATNGDAKNFTVKTIVYAISPVFKFTGLMEEKKVDFFFLFKNKQSLNEELNFLKEKNIELENEAILFESVQKENEELKILLSRPDKKNYILGSIISRPP